MTDDARISLGLIVRDEAASLDALLSQLRAHVDEIVVVDTGSRDDTVAIAARYADRVETFTACNDEDGLMADFAMARNHCMSLCSHDWFMWLDGDDLLGGHASALREVARETRPPEPTAVLAPYEYSYRPDGSVSCLLWRERLVWPRAAFVWTGPVHETLGRKDGKPVGARTQAFAVKHRRQFLDRPLDQGRNLRILQRHVRQSGITDVRSMHYLGTELAALGRHAEAVPHLRSAADLEGWDEARAQSLLALGRSLLALGDVPGALRAAADAAQEQASPGPYYLMHRARLEEARAGGTERDWMRAAHFARLGLALEPEWTPGLLPADPGEAEDARRGLAECVSRLSPQWASLMSPPLGWRGQGGTPRERVLRELPLCGLPEKTARLIPLLMDGTVRIDLSFSQAVERPVPLPEHVLPVLTPAMVGRAP